jgi:SAM-dependent methyltransferase
LYLALAAGVRAPIVGCLAAQVRSGAADSSLQRSKPTTVRAAWPAPLVRALSRPHVSEAGVLTSRLINFTTVPDMSIPVSMAYWLGRLIPLHLDLENDTDCFFFRSDTMRSATRETLERRLLASAAWRYEYELRNRTLDHAFDYPLEPLLRGKTVLDFGCFLGGTTVAWMEQYGIGKALGFDTEPLFAEGANLFARAKSAHAEFTAAYGESLPYPDASVDAIISVDVFEHVKDVGACLAECQRVLRSGGHLLAIFPPYFNPLNHHLKISNTPFLHWLFSGDTLRAMQNRRFHDYGDRARHFAIEDLNGYRSPYLNGITVQHFRQLVRAGAWNLVVDRRKGFPSAGERARSSRILRAMSRVSSSLAALPVLEEITLDHVSMILTKR